MYNEFQERLNELLIENNLSRLQLARKIGVTSEAINGYFNRNLYPEIRIAVRMAKFFNCSLDYLFGLSDVMKNGDKNSLSFIETLNKLMKDRNLSIAKTMKELNMSEYNYYRWRNGTRPLTSVLIELAKYFDVSVDYIIGDLAKEERTRQ